MAVIRLHLARKGLGLFNDLQNELSLFFSIVFLLDGRRLLSSNEMVIGFYPDIQETCRKIKTEASNFQEVS